MNHADDPLNGQRAAFQIQKDQLLLWQGLSQSDRQTVAIEIDDVDLDLADPAFRAQPRGKSITFQPAMGASFLRSLLRTWLRTSWGHAPRVWEICSRSRDAVGRFE